MKNIKKILFVCHGNICRSPLAEFLLKEAVKRLKLQDNFEIASAAVSDEEIGNGVYPPVKKILDKINIDCANKKARQITKQDLQNYDLIVLMDEMNLRYLHSMFHNFPKDKVKMLMEYTGTSRDVADPWYTRDFEATKNDITLALKSMLQTILPKIERAKIEKSCTF